MEEGDENKTTPQEHLNNSTNCAGAPKKNSGNCGDGTGGNNIRNNDHGRNDGQRKPNFICGVIEGFYGRPWTTEQRKDLFRKLKKWGMDSYVYAPKDDYKHRAYWRELYTVEEADHLSGLISAAKEHGITFYYALSPGLDMTYSSQKELQTLKRKLDQVSQFGCEAFALLFDDIESELSKTDKEVYQTFANAQVSVTNDIYIHLGNPRFLFCPTQYCGTRAVPTVHDSEYLNTLGCKLNHDIDIMWTGNKVISKIITLESIQEITEILRRPPVIWDNLHANDYDQKRVFLGPYSGRSPELISHLRGVMTNPNCEFHGNTIAIHTLAYWSRCSMDSKVNSSISADIKVETENDDDNCADDLPIECCLTKNIYHPRIALKKAITEWLPEFFIKKEAWGPITKPQPQVTMVMPIIPIIPSINTCMSLTTTTTTTSTNAKTSTVPQVNTTQLQALADVCSTVNSSSVNPISNAVMNSLVSPTKVVTNEDIVNPIPTTVASTIELPRKIPISIVPVPIMAPKEIATDTDSGDDMRDTDNETASCRKATNTIVSRKESVVERNEKEVLQEGHEPSKHEDDEDVTIEEKPVKQNNSALSIDTMVDDNLSPVSAGNEPMECSSSITSQTSPKDECGNPIILPANSNEDVIMAETCSNCDANNTMQVESVESSPVSNAEMTEVEKLSLDSGNNKINAEDLYFLCDLFYLPFEHGSRGCRMLNEFNWLKANAHVLLDVKAIKCHTSGTETPPTKPEVAEWLQRSEMFSKLCSSVHELLRKVALCDNKEICHDLFAYVWDIAGALSLLDAFVKWLSLGHFPANVYGYTQGTYTWFSKGWKEAFMSGDQEPWVFRGGLIADVQRLMPIDQGNDLFMYKLPDLPTTDYHTMRPFNIMDETAVNQVCTQGFLSLISAPLPAKNEENNAAAEPLSINDKFRDLIADSIVGPHITLHPEFCIVATDSRGKIVGYAAAALDAATFLRNAIVCWLPELKEKYPQSLLEEIKEDSTPLSAKVSETLRSMIKEMHNREPQCPPEVISSYPAEMTASVLEACLTPDYGVAKRLVTVLLATLRANGCFGVHIRLPSNNAAGDLLQFYLKLGFGEVFRGADNFIYLGRRF